MSDSINEIIRKEKYMFNITKTTYGVRMTFSGIVKLEEMNAWIQESMNILPDNPKDFYVFVDMRELEPVSLFVQRAFEKGQQLYKRKGMVRSVVVVNNNIVKRQFEKIAKESDIYIWERYIDANSNSDWEEKGMYWLLDTIDPDTGICDKNTVRIQTVD
ncbi:MAG: hypothetical protein U9N54_12740 [candidate division Zixibacteria bacterium]|nr:hypothetical protein [candidate division Zixibacteria bacterium]